ncbi:hypothetical protein BO86DRAFT_421317 [Aspergillus japonicus CBS 114.51]|uniref:Hydantoin racemase n=1 Tax=Aspergillus japonicus CBS 114.51 TaxID=1448312 RepID=A0A8T8WSG5_ASPJA|nr:hypothetical protein BO86DRAFT_421317 [Aspergillus japonicus CBS 114.51]RAH78788.1 hypothetical protein BO86DRAFT_421317 [Aspergillus japonicus CBS 114.51]
MTRAIKIVIITPVTMDLTFYKPQIDRLCRAGVEVTEISLIVGPASIESRVDEAMAVPGMLAAALQAEKAGAHALVISCMSDPGLSALREAVAIPVVGVAQVSMATAATLAHSFGIVTVLSRIAPILQANAAHCGYERQYVGCRAVEIPVLDVHRRAREVQDGLNRLALELVEQEGAGAVILGCGALLGCAGEIRGFLAERGMAVPVVDPLPTTVAFAVTLVEQGLSHSSVSYPPCQIKSYQGYELGEDQMGSRRF